MNARHWNIIYSKIIFNFIWSFTWIEPEQKKSLSLFFHILEKVKAELLFLGEKKKKKKVAVKIAVSISSVKWK